MPDRYHIHAVPLSPHFRRVGKYGNVDWREDCSRCTNCVKLRCIYDVYRHEVGYNRDPHTALETHDECKACLSCVMGCTKGLLSIGMNPEFLGMGDDYWKPDIMLTTWNQADTGKVPVSGAGYRGRFYGPGFDSIWTDMSEIVRPTRDGIHGREFISTSVDIGPKPMRLRFEADGKMVDEPSRLIELQIPAVLDAPDWPVLGPSLTLARVRAAKELTSLAVVPVAEAADLPTELLPWVVPLLSEGAGAPGEIDQYRDLLGSVRMVQVPDSLSVAELAAKLQDAYPDLIVCVRMDLTPASAVRIVELSGTAAAVTAAEPRARALGDGAGVKVFQLCADQHGRERLADGRPGRHIKDAVRDVHGRLVTGGLRDEITLVVSGGIALAEHMAKSIICGADLVAVGTPLLIALGCRLCSDRDLCIAEGRCPARLDGAELDYATQRLVNLFGSWHSQLLELLGAMGIREVRRLRGEVGRAMFLEDVEREAFGDLDRVAPSAVCS